MSTGKKQYVGGLDNSGRLVGFVHFINTSIEDLEAYVCGVALEPEPKERQWPKVSLSLGDEVTIKIVRRDDCDAPEDPDQLPKAAQKYIQEFYQSKYEKGGPDEGDG